MKMKNIEKQDYQSPKLNIIIFYPINTFSSMSASGDIMDFEEGGEYSGDYVDPLP